MSNLLPTFPRWPYAAMGILLALAISFYAGVRKGKTDERLSSNKTQIHASDSSIKTVQIRTDSAKVKVVAAETKHTAIRYSVKVIHDTVTTPGGVYVDPTLARLIMSADSTISVQKRALALQDSLVASLRKGIALRDTRIKLLESRGTSRISLGLQLGVGYCQTATSRTPCLYAGYGIQVRLP